MSVLHHWYQQLLIRTRIRGHEQDLAQQRNRQLIADEWRDRRLRKESLFIWRQGYQHQKELDDKASLHWTHRSLLKPALTIWMSSTQRRIHWSCHFTMHADTLLLSIKEGGLLHEFPINKIRSNEGTYRLAEEWHRYRLLVHSMIKWVKWRGEQHRRDKAKIQKTKEQHPYDDT